MLKGIEEVWGENTQIVTKSPFYLTSTRIENGKLAFRLNDYIFVPIIRSWNIDETEKLVQQEDKFRKDGFNIIYAALDYPWIFSKSQTIRKFLKTCDQLNIPVIVELQEWDYWRNWLKEHKKCNMKMCPFFGEYVQTYPDFANPETKQEHLRRFKAILEFLKPYYHKPVIAISIGAYDYYLIPDGVVHRDFIVPLHTQINQTWLPYGEYVLSDFKAYLEIHGFLLEDLGFSEWEEIYLPHDLDHAKNQNHWISWMQYRRKSYTLGWIRSTVDLVKRISTLPVTMTLDLRSSDWEIWGTPALEIDESLDFVVAYYYNVGPPEFGIIPQKLERVVKDYDRSNTPLISLMEFSSTGTPAEDYILQSSPYVSGFAILFHGGECRYNGFVETIKKVKEKNLWKAKEKKAYFAIFLSIEDIYVDEGVSQILYRQGISYDVIYNINDICNYKVIYIPAGQPILENNKEVQEILADFVKNGGVVIDRSKKDSLWEYLEGED